MSTRTIMLNALKSGMFNWRKGRLKSESLRGTTCHCAFGALLEALETPSRTVTIQGFGKEAVSGVQEFVYGDGRFITHPPDELAPREIRTEIMNANDLSPTQSYKEVIEYLESIPDWD